MFSKENRANTIHGILLIALFSFAAFYIAEIPFEDIRIEIDQWPQHKESRFLQ